MRKFHMNLLFGFFFMHTFAQVESDPLFSTATPLDIAFSISTKTIRNSKIDSVYFKQKMYYRNAAGTADSIKIAVKRRGHFRLEQCYFPPLWMKIDKNAGKNTLFEGNKKLKLVMPCDSRSESNDLILREYICYKLYETVTSFSFRSRLVNIEITDEKGKKTKDYHLKGILIEDVDKTAKRCGSKVASGARIAGSALNDTCALRFDLFQLMIANTDWSKLSQHNSKLIIHNSGYIPLPYDFDMSGVVDAPYSFVSLAGDDKLPIEDVKERYYRGYCTANEITQFVRHEFLAKQEKLMAVPDELKGLLSNKEIEGIKTYLEKFFEILKHDKSFDSEVVSKCRTM